MGAVDAAFWSAVEAFAWPVLFLLATPFFFGRLGGEQFGFLMLVNAVAMFGAVVGLGIAPAVVKFVSSAIGRGDATDANRTVRASISVAVSVGVLWCGMILLARHGISEGLFSRLGDPAHTATLVLLGSITVALQQLDAVFGAGLKGLERFDLSAVWDVVTRCIMMAGMLAAAWWWGTAPAVVQAQQAALICGCFLKRAALARQLGGVPLIPSLDLERVGQVIAFGKWVWMQNVSGIVVFAADRLVVASLFGAPTLSAYSICQQGAQVIHTTVSACFQRLLPRIGAAQPGPGQEQLRGIVARSIRANIIIAVAFFGPAVLMSGPVLSLWMGPEFAAANQRLFEIFLVINLLLAMNVSSYFILLGFGESKLVGIYTAIGAALSIVLLLALTPIWGPMWAAASRLPYVLIALLFIGKALTIAGARSRVAQPHPLHHV